MKIEKLNENQIRCTLTHADLAARHLKLSELAYGTEKAKSLFRDMMQQASFDFGFEAENILECFEQQCYNTNIKNNRPQGVDLIREDQKSHPVLGQSFGVVFLCKELLTKR